MTIAEALAEHIAGVTYDALPRDAVHWSKVAILDTVGVTLAGSSEPCARIVARVTTAGASTGQSLIFGTDRRVAPLDAALINGTAAHALDFDDCSNTLGGHPSAPILPALFALAESAAVLLVQQSNPDAAAAGLHRHSSVLSNQRIRTDDQRGANRRGQVGRPVSKVAGRIQCDGCQRPLQRGRLLRLVRHGDARHGGLLLQSGVEELHLRRCRPAEPGLRRNPQRNVVICPDGCRPCRPNPRQ